MLLSTNHAGDSSSAGIETSRFFGANIGRPGSTLIEVFRFAGDSPLEGDGFEPSVPLGGQAPSQIRNQSSLPFADDLAGLKSS